MGRPEAVGNCTECGFDGLHALGMCKVCYQRNYMRRRREQEKEQLRRQQMENYRESIPKEEK